MALIVSSAFRTVSRDAAHVISGLLPIEILVEEPRRIYQHRSQRQSDADHCRKRERQKSLQRWQAQWDSSEKGRWTHQLVPRIAEWVNRKHGDPSYYLTQMLTGHGCFENTYTSISTRTRMPNMSRIRGGRKACVVHMSQI